jgi:hypothetical protein
LINRPLEPCGEDLTIVKPAGTFLVEVTVVPTVAIRFHKLPHPGLVKHLSIAGNPNRELVEHSHRHSSIPATQQLNCCGVAPRVIRWNYDTMTIDFCKIVVFNIVIDRTYEQKRRK